VGLPGFAGDVSAVSVLRPDGTAVPVRLRDGEVWPQRKLPSGERLTIVVTVRRPGWAGWLVGHTERRRATIRTPTARLAGRWLEVEPAKPVRLAFDHPVTLVAFGHGRARQLPRRRAVVSTGVVAQGSHSAGSVLVAAAARPWERLSAPVRVTWFPKRPYPQLLTAPGVGAPLAPTRELRLTFSRPVEEVVGEGRPQVVPATPGRWRLLDEHTLAFRPRGLGFGLDSDVAVRLPVGVHLAGQHGAEATRVLRWRVPPASTLRLQELLAELGYLPVDWQPTGDTTPATATAQLAAALEPPPGQFSWRYENTPRELQALWHPGQIDQITRGAVMMFQDTHGLVVDSFAGPRVWRALLGDVLAGKHRPEGYSYVYVHRSVPQSLNLWHNGQLVLSSPGNTGVPAAPTNLGTYPVFEHIPVGTMSGTNPDGTHYNDPGIRFISYFHGGEAIHAFNRSSFGTPQSLGCVELPLAAAATVWPYTPIGTLVTIED
jgi:hypothetical protein